MLTLAEKPDKQFLLSSLNGLKEIARKIIKQVAQLRILLTRSDLENKFIGKVYFEKWLCEVVDDSSNEKY